jgi:biotin--protein ligase
MVSQEASPVPSLSRLHLSSINPVEVSGLLEDLKDIIISEDGEEYIKGENDTFRIEKNHYQRTLDSLATSLGNMNSPSTEDSKADSFNGIPDRNIDYNKVVKILIPHETDWPGSRETPYFNHQCFYSNLRKYQQGRGIEADEFGKMLLYGEVVTSTNTILEKWVDAVLLCTILTLTSEITSFWHIFQKDLLLPLQPKSLDVAVAQMSGSHPLDHSYSQLA